MDFLFKVRRAQIANVAIMIVLIISFTLACLVSLKVTQSFMAGYDGEDSNIVANIYATFSNLDLVSVLTVLGFMIGFVITGYRIKSHPVYFVINMLAFIVFVWVVPLLSNALTDVMNSESLDSVSSNFPLEVWLRDNYPLIAVVGGGLFLLAMYIAKNVGDQGVSNA